LHTEPKTSQFVFRGLDTGSYLRCVRLVCVIAALCTGWVSSVIALEPGREISKYGHRIWRTENGLPQNTVRAILQTMDGYIWLATEEGLVRFDGIRFSTFDKKNVPEMASNNIQVLYPDSEGGLWIGTDEGLLRLFNGSFTAYSASNGLSNNNIGSIFEAKDGSIWIGTAGGLDRLKDGHITSFTTKDGLPGDGVRLIDQDSLGNLWISTPGGLGRFDGNSFAVYTLREGLPAINVSVVYENKKGDLWVGTSGGLALFKDNRFSSYTTESGLANNIIWSIEEDDAGSLWLGTDGGLVKFKDGKFTTYTTQDGLPDNSVLSIYKDRNATLWFSTPGGLGRLSNGRLSSYTTRDGLSSNVVLAICEDREGSLWVGTEAGGLNVFKDAKFITYTTRDGLSDDMVWTVCATHDGSLWIGSQGGGLSRLKDGQITTFTKRDGLPSNLVRALCEDKEGTLWIGTPLGLTQLKAGRFTNYTVQDGLANNAVWSIHQDRQGNLWIGTLGGLSRLTNGNFTVFTTKDGLSDDGVLSIQSDAKGNLWIGTRNGGLNRLTDGRFLSYTADQGLSDNSIRSIYEDGEGGLWIGTRRGGLVRLKSGKFSAITTKDGLPDDCVYQILDDKRGNLWMSSTKGIFKVSRNELDAFADGRLTKVTPVSYGTADGMESRECNGGQPAGWRDDDGRLWFPTVKGLAVIDPMNLKINQVLPPVRIEQIIADNKPIDTSKKADLPSGTERLELRYTALSFVAPEKIQFKYRLEGYDKDWIAAGDARAAQYTGIPPGDYSFRVIACNDDGVWNEAGASYSFYLRPRFYQTLWFYMLLAAGVGVIAYSLYHLRIRQMKAQFSAVLAERGRMAREIHDTLAQGFVGIALQLDAVGKTLREAPQKAHHHLELAQKMVTHSLTEARRTVWDLRSQALERGDLATALSDVAKQATAGTEVQAQLNIVGIPRRLEATIENNLLRIGQEAVTNAARHAQATRILIELRFEPKQIRLFVGDDGCGFDPHQGRSFSDDGHFGLIGMRERAERIKGNIDIKSHQGKGTEIAVDVLLG